VILTENTVIPAWCWPESRGVNPRTIRFSTLGAYVAVVLTSDVL